MDITESVINENVSVFRRLLQWLKALMDNIQHKIVEVGKMTMKLGKDDPRRIVHSLKAGLALTLVSSIYYFQALYDTFGASAMWAVITFVVVLEFSVGATIGKGLNRTLATIVAGALGVGAHYLALVFGKIGEPIIIGSFVFLQAAITTYLRFFPKIKARYDYGMLIFILTFCMVSEYGFQNAKILELSQKRLSTIAIGVSACVIVSIFVFPVWAGEDLHNLIALNIEKLGNFLEGYGEEYSRTTGEEKLKDENSLTLGYKSVLGFGCESTEETLANFAIWEPGHGRFMYRHPWKQYLKIGALIRQCAYRIDALNTYSSKQITTGLSGRVQVICGKMSSDSGKAMKKLAYAIKIMTTPSSSVSHLANSKAGVENLKTMLKSELWKEVEFAEMIQVVTVASLLVDILMCVENIAESVNELALLAGFKSLDSNIDYETPHKFYKGSCNAIC